MLITHRSIALPGSVAKLATHAVVHSGYRVHSVLRQGVVSDDDLLLRGFERRGGLGRPIATVLLEGRARLRWRTDLKWLEPGELAVVPDKSDVAMRQEGATYRSVVIEWEPGRFGERPDPKVGIHHATVERGLLDACEELSRSVSSLDASLPIRQMADLWRRLLHAGVPLRKIHDPDLVEPVSDAMRELSRALDHALSAPGGMLVDLEGELALSTRQLNRLVRSFNEHYAFNAEGWRDLRNRYRVMMAAALLTSEDATIEGVARSVGFTSAATLSRALANMGLPRPSEIRDATMRLGTSRPTP